jgi:hypothetical protein
MSKTIITQPDNLCIEEVVTDIIDGRVRVIILQGAQGSGKSTYYGRIADKLRAREITAVQCSADLYMIEDGKYKFAFDKLVPAHTAAGKDALEAYRAGNIVIIDNTNIKPWYVKSYLAPLVEEGLSASQLVIVRLTGTFPNVHHVPETAVILAREQMEDLSFDSIMSATPPPPRVPAPAPDVAPVPAPDAARVPAAAPAPAPAPDAAPDA